MKNRKGPNLKVEASFPTETARSADYARFSALAKLPRSRSIFFCNNMIA
jgi:hypothetical protein